MLPVYEGYEACIGQTRAARPYTERSAPPPRSWGLSRPELCTLFAMDSHMLIARPPTASQPCQATPRLPGLRHDVRDWFCRRRLADVRQGGRAGKMLKRCQCFSLTDIAFVDVFALTCASCRVCCPRPTHAIGCPRIRSLPRACYSLQGKRRSPRCAAFSIDWLYLLPRPLTGSCARVLVRADLRQ